MGQLDNRVVWITGGGSGLGRAMALEAADRGAAVAVSGRRLEPLQRVVADVVATGGRAAAVACDVTDEAAVEAAVKQVLATFGRLDVAIANAGFSVNGEVAELSAADWRRQFDVNVVGAANTAKYTIPALAEQQGRLALVASVAAFVSAPGHGAYNASKAALRALGHTLSAELAPQKVSCTTLHPGFVESDIAKVDNDGVFHKERDDGRPQFLMWKADRAARVMIDAVMRRKREYVFTGHGRIGAALGQHAPGLAGFLLRKRR